MDLEGQGLISGDDGQRYRFTRGDLAGGLRTTHAGDDVDFEAADGVAKEIVIVKAARGASSEKSKVVAALLAIFLGMLGIHKFYLGRTGAGVIMLLSGTIGWILFAIPPAIIAIISIIEFVIYLTMSDEQFERDYVIGNKAWF